jgi:hypothetical protein
MKKVMIVLFILLSLSCKEKDSNSITNTVLAHGNDTIKVPVLKINKKEFTTIDNLHFHHSVGGKPIQEETFVSMKYDTDFLEIKFECRSNPRLDQNYYTKDNTPIYKQEVFEIFISKGEEVQEKYLEIELNPNNALFLGKVLNRYKSDGKYAFEYIETNTSGIVHTVEKDYKNNTWKGYLKLPLTLLQYPNPTSDQIYRLNMFRVISNVDHTDKNWSATEKNSTFACWNSTMGETPYFHVPESFGILILE